MLKLETIATGLKGAHNIMDRWGATAEQKRAVLVVFPDEFIEQSFNDDEVQGIAMRVSYILNIYKTCRTLFTNPNNQDNYVCMEHSYFDGKSMLEVMAKTGDIEDIERVFKYCMGVLHN